MGTKNSCQNFRIKLQECRQVLATYPKILTIIQVLYKI